MPSATDAPPSPSPPPAPPTALTPGLRAEAFTNLYSKTLTATLHSIPYASFAACFPSIAETAPAALQAMHTNLVERLEHFAKEDFEGIMRERKVVEKLNELDDVIAEARRRRARAVEGDEAPVALHTLPPTQLLQSHLSPIHAQQQSLLNAKLQTTASQNASLAEEIRKQREEISSLMSVAEKLVGDLESSGEMMAGVVNGDEGVSARARGAEEILDGM